VDTLCPLPVAGMGIGSAKPNLFRPSELKLNAGLPSRTKFAACDEQRRKKKDRNMLSDGWRREWQVAEL